MSRMRCIGYEDNFNSYSIASLVSFGQYLAIGNQAAKIVIEINRLNTQVTYDQLAKFNLHVCIKLVNFPLNNVPVEIVNLQICITTGVFENVSYIPGVDNSPDSISCFLITPTVFRVTFSIVAAVASGIIPLPFSHRVGLILAF